MSDTDNSQACNAVFHLPGSKIFSYKVMSVPPEIVNSFQDIRPNFGIEVLESFISRHFGTQLVNGWLTINYWQKCKMVVNIFLA